MDFIQSIINNFIHPPVLFFALGLVAVLLKSDLEIPPQIGKYLSLYLLFHIGILGGEELFHSGFNATLEAHHIHFDGYMVAGMALMESPAIIAGLIIVKFALNKTDENSQTRMGKVFHEAFTNSSVLLLIGSMVIGYICGISGEQELKPFVGDIFKGMLLLTILVASASYIAVPAAMRLAVPQANMSLLLPMSLGLTFSLNVTLGIPLYYAIIERLWG